MLTSIENSAPASTAPATNMSAALSSGVLSALADDAPAPKAKGRTNTSPAKSGGRSAPAKGANLSVWLARQLKRQYPNVTVVYSGGDAATPSLYRNWLDDTGWADTPTRDIRNAAHDILRPHALTNTSLQGVVGNALADFAARSGSSDASDWNANLDFLPFAGSTKGLRLSDGAVAEVPRKALMIARLGATGLADWQGGIWDKCLDQWFPDVETKRTVLMVFGQALLGNPENKWLFFQSSGGEGKSTFTHSLKYALGYFADYLPINSLIAQSNEPHPTGLISIEGRRVVFSSEIPAGATWRENTLKDITGGDAIPVRAMRENFRIVEAHCLLVTTGNHEPHIRDTGRSMKRRLVKVCFTKPANDDPTLKTKLRSGTVPEQIIASLAWGLREYRQHGLSVGAAIQAESADYLESEDELGSELAKIITIDASANINLVHLRTALKARDIEHTLTALKGKLEDMGLNLDTGSGNKRIIRGCKMAKS